MTHTAPTLTQTRAWYDWLSRFYDWLADGSERPARLRGLRLLNAKPGEAVLEIGVGTGGALVHLAHAVSPRGHVVGLDLSGGMLAKARERAEREGVTPLIQLHQGNALTFPWEPQSFDAAFMSFTLELFSDAAQLQLLERVRQTLRPGGRLVVVFLSREPRPSFASRLYEWLHRRFPRYLDCHPIDAELCLRESGFRVTVSEPFSLWGIAGRAVLALA